MLPSEGPAGASATELRAAFARLAALLADVPDEHAARAAHVPYPWYLERGQRVLARLGDGRPLPTPADQEPAFPSHHWAPYWLRDFDEASVLLPHLLAAAERTLGLSPISWKNE